MIDDGIMKSSYVETTDNTLKNYQDFKTFYIKTFIITNATVICNLIAMNQHIFMEQLKHTNLKL